MYFVYIPKFTEIKKAQFSKPRLFPAYLQPQIRNTKDPTQQTRFISNHLYRTAIWVLDVVAKLSCQLKALCAWV